MGGKRKGHGHRGPKGPADHELAGLLASAHEAVERAIGAVGTEALSPGAAVPEQVPGRPVDPLLLDRYEGLLSRSGIVAGTVHLLPSRLGERVEAALRELIVGVARDRPITVERVDALVDELLILVGERIACQVEAWRDPTG